MLARRSANVDKLSLSLTTSYETLPTIIWRARRWIFSSDFDYQLVTVGLESNAEYRHRERRFLVALVTNLNTGTCLNATERSDPNSWWMQSIISNINTYLSFSTTPANNRRPGAVRVWRSLHSAVHILLRFICGVRISIRLYCTPAYLFPRTQSQSA